MQKTMIPLLTLWALFICFIHRATPCMPASFTHLTEWTTPKPTKSMIEKEKRRFQVLVTEAQPLEAKEGGMKAMRA